MPATIAALGDRDPAYLTHREIDAALPLAPAGVEARWVATDSEEARRIDSFDALWVLPGTPYRDDDVVYAAIRFAREGLAGARDVRRLSVHGGRIRPQRGRYSGSYHAETDPDGEAIVVGQLSCSLVGEERRVTAVRGRASRCLCGTAPFIGFHWCSYGLADGVAERLAAAGLVMSAHARDAGVEGFELPGHPFYAAPVSAPGRELRARRTASAARCARAGRCRAAAGARGARAAPV